MADHLCGIMVFLCDLFCVALYPDDQVWECKFLGFLDSERKRSDHITGPNHFRRWISSFISHFTHHHYDTKTMKTEPNQSLQTMQFSL